MNSHISSLMPTDSTPSHSSSSQSNGAPELDSVRMREQLRRVSGKVAVVGSANADLTIQTKSLPKPGQTVHGSALKILPGGKSANQSVQAARLGAEVAFIGALGNDPNASVLQNSLRGAEVNLDGCENVEDATGAAVITVDAEAENTIVLSPGANAHVNAQFVGRHAEAIRGAEVLGLCFEIPMDGIIEAAKIAHEAGTRVFLNPSPYEDVPEELLALTDVLVVNEGELAGLLGEALDDDAALVENSETQQQIAGKLAEHGVKRAIITLGSEGSIVVDGGQATRIPPVRTKAVDTTGCGDSYFGSLLAFSAAGDSLIEAAQGASFVSSVAATSLGAQSSYATCSELELELG